MADIKQLKIKIQSTKNIKKITNALEIISTIKLQKTKKKTEHLRDYVHSLLHIIALMMAKGVSLSDRVYTDAVIERSLLVVIASEKGLCGSLNSQLFKSIDTKYSDHKDAVHIYAVGKKAVEFFSRRGYTIVGKTFLTDNVDDDELLDMFTLLSSPAMAKTYTHINVCYNYFKNVMKQIPLSFSLFPMTEATITEFMQLIDIPFDIKSMLSKTIDIVVEPDMETLQKHVKRMIIDYIVYGAILHNKTGEFAARMIAMKGAKDNAVNIISDLTLSYNKARQDAITKEVLEIVSAKAVIED